MTLDTVTSRATRAVIDLSACRHNLLQAKHTAPDSKHIAIIKANAYGHGMVPVAHALREADVFGVATISEGMQLRDAGIKQPVLLLEGFSNENELNLVRGYRLDAVIHHESQLQMLEQSKGKAISTWLKIDTGMHRLGFSPQDIKKIVKRMHECPQVKQPLRFMTHLANADDKQDDKTLSQVDNFYQSLEKVTDAKSKNKPETSIANSAGILGWPQSHADWNRPGIMLYGSSPFINSTASDHNLRPVMTLSSSIISINRHKQGDAIGYGGSYVCDKDMTIGVVAIGYGDGYPRHAKSGTPVLVNGKRSKLLGRVSMDMICIDLTDQDDVKIGDAVVLWGEGLPVEEIASCAGTISYELTCGVTRRVEFIYVD